MQDHNQAPPAQRARLVPASPPVRAGLSNSRGAQVPHGKQTALSYEQEAGSPATRLVAGFSLGARAAYMCMRITFNTRSQNKSGLRSPALAKSMIRLAMASLM